MVCGDVSIACAEVKGDGGDDGQHSMEQVSQEQTVCAPTDE
jgi:hypothetical protein